MFPLLKLKDEKGRLFKVDVIKENGVTIEMDEDDAKHDTNAKPFHQFYLTNEEFGDNMDNYCQVSKNTVEIFD